MGVIITMAGRTVCKATAAYAYPGTFDGRVLGVDFSEVKGLRISIGRTNSPGQLYQVF